MDSLNPDRGFPLSHVTERDVDILLVEELHCSSTFQKWFFDLLRGLLPKGDTSGVTVRHSVSGAGPGSGETDIEVSAIVGKARVLIHIEDKVHSPFTPRQAARYRERGKHCIAQEKCDLAVSVLMAPEEYLAGVALKDFDEQISYQRIAAYFAAQEACGDPETAARASHRRRILEQAIARQRRGWMPTPVAEVTSIWNRYAAIATADYPDLCMKTSGNSGDSYTVSFLCLNAVSGLPKCRIENVMERGYVQILLPGLAGQIQRLRSRLAPLLDQGMSMQPAGKSLAIRIKTPEIRRMEKPEPQEGAIDETLKAAMRLKRWFERNAHALASGS